ncbi:translational activator of cytochrome c oxidase 1 [Clupea harengus]|uniref:Translational activator of cytochrome c oxidase 1 n=1 Tax=Clupea harengus TaxID=7950 RepID=A0A6P8F2I6_CLUHA|nr:translational activator of cytochrome c oxidase 1 [Clupea harengus]XP_031417358.1 translational activator of cytochrome c oxidase 1 [Clupea harengus]
MAGAAVLLAFLPYSCRVALSQASLVPRIGCVTKVCASVLPSLSRWDSRPVRGIHHTPPVCAGHNKWSKVRTVKIPRDAARARMMAKLTMMIRVAVREGGTNPEFNLALAQIIEQCRNKSIPKATIENSIKGAEKSKGGTQHLYEVRGPGGYVALVEVITENNNRANQEIRHLLSKHGAAVCDGARHSFSRKGVVMATRGDMSSDQALDLAIEAGAEDVQETEDEEERAMLQFICGMADMRGVRAELEKLGVTTVSSGLEYVATATAPLGEEQLSDAHELLEALKDYPDVLCVWDNIEARD